MWRKWLVFTTVSGLLAGSAFAQSSSNPSGSSSGTSTPTVSGPTTPGGSASEGSKTPGGTSTEGSTMRSGTGSSMSGATGTTEKMDKATEGKRGHRAKGASAGKAHVREAQQALKDKGHDPGPIDGIMGPKTQAALRKFQQAEGLTTTGRLDDETRSKLGVGMAAAPGRFEQAAPSASPSTDTSSPPASAPSGDSSQQGGSGEKSPPGR